MSYSEQKLLELLGHSLRKLKKKKKGPARGFSFYLQSLSKQQLLVLFRLWVQQ